MLSKCLAEVKIQKVDNGYIVDWEQEKPKRVRGFSALSDDNDIWGPRGVEIIKDKKALLKRLGEIL